MRELPADVVELWSEVRSARLFEDVDHGQWGLVLLDPQASVVRTTDEQRERPRDFRVDDLYDYWQNAEDPLLFSVAGRSIAGLPTRHNGLPPPLDQVVIDTTCNPGRMILRDGYVEAIGHKMWLGPEFFRRVPESSSGALYEAPWARVVELRDGLVELVSSATPFVDETSLEVQFALRRLLFPTTFDKRSTKQGHDVRPA